MKNFIYLLLLVSLNSYGQITVEKYVIGMTVNKKAESFVVEALELNVDDNLDSSAYLWRKIPRHHEEYYEHLDDKIKLVKVDLGQSNPTMESAQKLIFEVIKKDRFNYYKIPASQLNKGSNKISLIYKTNSFILQNNKDKASVLIDILEPDSWILDSPKKQRLVLKNIQFNYIDLFNQEPRQSNIFKPLNKKLTVKIDYPHDYFELSLKARLLIYYRWHIYWGSTIFMLFAFLFIYRKINENKKD